MFSILLCILFGIFIFMVLHSIRQIKIIKREILKLADGSIKEMKILSEEQYIKLRKINE